MASSPVTMEPLSARIPSELYLWLAQLQVEGATTTSDKLRVLLAQLKRQHDGGVDYLAAHTWARELTGRLRDALVRTEGATGEHSEVLLALLEHITSTLALVVSQVPANAQEAARLEDTLVKRTFALAETLLRQATTAQAAAYDPAVVRRHMGGTLALAQAIQSHSPA